MIDSLSSDEYIEIIQNINVLFYKMSILFTIYILFMSMYLHVNKKIIWYGLSILNIIWRITTFLWHIGSFILFPIAIPLIQLNVKSYPYFYYNIYAQLIIQDMMYLIHQRFIHFGTTGCIYISCNQPDYLYSPHLLWYIQCIFAPKYFYYYFNYNTFYYYLYCDIMFILLSCFMYCIFK